MQEYSSSDDIKLLLEVLPPRVRKIIDSTPPSKILIEVILDLGKLPEIRFDKDVVYVEGGLIGRPDISYVISKVGEFTSDNRAGIERTLHRISAIRNRRGEIIGLTCRVGRAIFGTNDIIRDVIESGKNILFLGPPGIGKTTKLRETARILSDQFKKRVVIVDTSNEIGGDGDIPHPGIGKARRMQVPGPEQQHKVMIEAVENHMPEVIIVDEIGTEEEAKAARTIAERGVQLIGTAHGTSLDNLLNNPTLSDLLGGIQTVILGDEEAKRRNTQKSVLERKAPPTFDILIEIRERDLFAIYPDVSKAVDKFLRGRSPQPEIRLRTAEGKIKVTQEHKEEIPEITQAQKEEILSEKEREIVKIFPFAVNKGQIDRAIQMLQLPAEVANSLDETDLILTLKSKAKKSSKIIKSAEERQIPVHVIRKNVSSQIMRFLKYYFRVKEPVGNEDIALRETNNAIQEIINTHKSIDLNPQNAYVRRLQHKLVEDNGLHSESVGEEPKRRLRIYPK